MLKKLYPNRYPEHMSEGSYNESDDEHLFEHPDDEMDLSIPVVDSEADDHWRSVPRHNWPRRQAPADLEQFLRERAKKKEKRYFELLSGAHGELDDHVRNMR